MNFFPLVIFTGKLHKKDPQQSSETKRFLVFLLEKHVSMNQCDQELY